MIVVRTSEDGEEKNKLFSLKTKPGLRPLLNFVLLEFSLNHLRAKCSEQSQAEHKYEAFHLKNDSGGLLQSSAIGTAGSVV